MVLFFLRVNGVIFTPEFLFFKFNQAQGMLKFKKIWAEVDSNHRTLAGTDLQSVAFSHSAIYPYLLNLFIVDLLIEYLIVNLRFPCSV